MRVGYELTALELDRSGTARVIDRLGAELERDADVQVVPLSQPGRAWTGRAGRIARGLARELCYLPLALPRRARRLRLDLLHCPAALAPARSRVPLVITVHDVMAWRHPEWFTRANVIQQRLVLARAARGAAAVITGSEFSRREAIEVLGLEPERVHAVHYGIDERFCPGPPPQELLERLDVGGRYLLALGPLQPRKNLEAAIAAFERLTLSGSTEHHLVIAGARGWGDEALMRRLERSSERTRIHLTGRVSDDELIGLYRGADCLVFPSLYEGFGFPPLEAMACGTPVVCSGRTSLPEVTGDDAVLVDPTNPDALGGAVSALVGSDERRAELSERGLARAAHFTWRRCAQQTIAVYERALESEQ